MGTTRTRLTSGQRREQLLAIGAELFAARPYEEVWIEEVAELARVSRGLLYHYFPTKRDFFAAVVRAEGERILELTRPDPELPPAEQLAAGLDAYLTYVEQHRTGYRVIQRAAVAVDAGVREIVEECLAVQQRRMLAALAAVREPDEAAELAVRGWLTFVVTVCLEWLDRPTVSREQLHAMCVRSLLAAMEPHL